jgi:hypothetical protein
MRVNKSAGQRVAAWLSSWRRGGPATPLSESAVLIPVALGTMLAPLNSTMIAVALPDLLGDFGRSLA